MTSDAATVMSLADVDLRGCPRARFPCLGTAWGLPGDCLGTQLKRGGEQPYTETSQA